MGTRWLINNQITAIFRQSVILTNSLINREITEIKGITKSH
jgi:hypothetical protein